MYFNEKEDTNIDKEFKKEPKFDFQKYKKIIIIGGIALLVLIIIIIAILAFKNRKVYYLYLNGGNEINVYKGSNYIDPGYEARDNYNHNLNNAVIVTGTVDENTIGTYNIRYTLKDKTVTRIVNVIASQSQFTKIYLEGSKEMTIKLGSVYHEPGYYYNDVLVGDIRDRIKVNGKVNTSKAGKYRLTYTVVNSENVTITAERIVTVE